jgi:hypothetical protein
MYITTRHVTGSTFMTCNVCGQAFGMNKMCETPLQSAADMLQHLSAHKASSTVAVAEAVAKPESIPVNHTEQLVQRRWHFPPQ